MAIANALAFLLYMGGSVVLIRQFVQKDTQAPSSGVPANILIISALLFHTIDIAFTMKNAGGWDLALFSTFALISWVMAFIATIAGYRFPKSHPGIVIYPIVALSLMLKMELDKGEAFSLPNPALEWHILLSLAAYSFFLMAAIQAIVVAILEKQLRRHQITNMVKKLPPLETMERTLFQLISTGFILLTLGLVTGFVFISDLFAQHLVHKTVLSVISWFVFAGLLWGRYKYGWRGRTAVKWTLVGFTFLLLAYAGSKFVLEYLLN